MSKDDIGDRLKSYERIETEKRLDISLPIYARIDGRSFSKFTRDFGRPYNTCIADAMIETTKFLIEQTHASIGYTQSDEISLIWKPTQTENSSSFFDGKIQKLTSILASISTAKFIVQMEPQYQNKFPHFDARIFNLPDISEATNAIVWRQIDARKNAISMLARCYFSHRELHEKTGKQMLEMLENKFVRFEDYPNHFKSGTLLTRETVERDLTKKELEKIPENYRPVGPVIRSQIKTLDVYPLAKVTNKIQVLFENAEVER